MTALRRYGSPRPKASKLPFELNRQVLIPVHVNDSGPFAFVLDSGTPVTGLIETRKPSGWSCPSAAASQWEARANGSLDTDRVS